MTQSKHLSFQCKPQPIFTFRIFGSWPSKPNCNNIRVSELNGKPSVHWTSMKQLYYYLVSDISIENQKSLLSQFKSQLYQTDTDHNDPNSNGTNDGKTTTAMGTSTVTKQNSDNLDLVQADSPAQVQANGPLKEKENSKKTSKKSRKGKNKSKQKVSQTKQHLLKRLDALHTAFDFGYKYPQWMLQVCNIVFV